MPTNTKEMAKTRDTKTSKNQTIMNFDTSNGQIMTKPNNNQKVFSQPIIVFAPENPSSSKRNSLFVIVVIVYIVFIIGLSFTLYFHLIGKIHLIDDVFKILTTTLSILIVSPFLIIMRNLFPRK